MINWADLPSLPFVGTPKLEITFGSEFAQWLSCHLDDLNERLDLHGALLLRGFVIRDNEDFRTVSKSIVGDLGSYIGGNSPRTEVASKVFTSTEYPRGETISLHNEASYLKQMPRNIVFHCIRPADTGGSTPLADCRRVLACISDPVVERFEKFGVMYIRNMHGSRGLGQPWSKVFGTTDKHAIERLLAQDNVAYEWTRSGGLKTWTIAPATVTHPRTGAKAWINQAEQWHPTALSDTVRGQLSAILSEDEFPHNARFGDGSPIPHEDLHVVRKAMARQKRTFEWKRGDLLICDNILSMHGRESFSGDRRVIVAISANTIY